MVAVEMCAGSGGLSRGLTWSGIDIAVAVECNRHSAATYRQNFPTVDLIERDIRGIGGDEILRRLNFQRGQLGALVAGLPCQGFSESNRRTRTSENPQNQLYLQVIKMLLEIAPRWFVIENVAGIATLESGRFLDSMVEQFSSLGYRVVHEILNARDYGVPQIRRRTFLVGNRVDREFQFPEVVDGLAPTVLDAIEDLPVLENGANVEVLEYQSRWSEISTYAKSLRSSGSQVVSGNVVSCNSHRVLERYRYIKMGQNWRVIPPKLMSNYKHRQSCHTGIYHRLSWDGPSKVIGNFRKNMLIHPSQDRGLSIREAARLQSFPDCHEFIGPLNDRQQQVGDAVPPLLARAIGVALQGCDRGDVS